MFNIFNVKKDERRALELEIKRRLALFQKAMARHGINSSQARDFDQQISALEAKLNLA